MGPARVIILVVALTAAIGAAVVVRGMAKGQAQPVAAAAPAAAPVVERPMTEVLIAKRDLPPGTTLVEEDMAWQAWPKDSMNELFVTKETTFGADQEKGVAKVAATAAEAAKDAMTGPAPGMAGLLGAVVREAILAGEPMTARKLVRPGTAGIMAITLDPGMRAMAVPLSAESAAGGFILPGDHVDVVQSREVENAGGAKRFVSGTVMRNVKVLAIDQATGAEGAAVVGATATLQVDSKQAEVLVLAKSQGSLTLVLRSYADTAGLAQTVAQADTSEDLAFKSPEVRVFRSTKPDVVTVIR